MFPSYSTPEYFLKPGNFTPLAIDCDEIMGQEEFIKSCENSYSRRLKKVMEYLLNKQFHTPSSHDVNILKTYGRLSRSTESEQAQIFQDLLFRITVLASRYFDPSPLAHEDRVYTGDKVLGRALFHVAAEAGTAEAIYRLGSCFEKGQGGPEDHSIARSLYKLALKKGSLSAYDTLLRLRHLPVDTIRPQGGLSPSMSMTGEGELSIYLPAPPSSYPFRYIGKSDFLNMA
ncbi:MAG: hypothetical protein ACI9S8_002965 [Chlamydiales bacterium]|jgi:hypothetical protein